MSIVVHVVTLGIAATNAYLVADTETNEAILIDPVDQAPLLKQMADQRGWSIKLILATHAHFDHVLASKALKELTGAPFYIHEECVSWLESLPEQGLMFTGQMFPEAAKPDRLLRSMSELIEVGAIRLESIYTSGHAPGHLSFYLRSENIVFSGDALFAGSIGRTDLPGGSYDVLIASIFNQLLPLGDDVRLFPGHGGESTMGHERRTNPFLQF